MRNIILVILLVAAVAGVQQTYKICAPDTISGNSCLALQRGESRVSCVRVADSADCAIRMIKKEVDFAIFNAEELLMIYKFYPSNILPIIQLRHEDKLEEKFEFQTVAVVPKDLTQMIIIPGSGFNHLRDIGFCHPGFSKSSGWSDYVLKHFEKVVIPPSCQENVTIIENQLINLKNFFGKSCRPGQWAAENSIDQALKKKYPELCALCDNKASCSYNDISKHGHIGALDCLINGRGKVAYTELSYVYSHLKINSSYEFLCPDGTTLPLNSPTPCTWLRQPWKVIAARKDIADVLKPDLLRWLNPSSNDYWKILKQILLEDSVAINMTEILSLASYLSTGRNIDLLDPLTCDKTIRWCTIGYLETNKCEWIARSAKALGIEPHISCVEMNSTFECFRGITENRADIITIDSNYGHLARTVYGLSTVLYSETEQDKNSIVIAVVREPKDNNYPIKSLFDLKGRTACFPEYAGISWMSFINIARKSGLISSKSCDYPFLVANLLSGACTPGIKDNDHSHPINRTSPEISSKLCSACMRANNTSCGMNKTNSYAFDRGAIRCLNEGAGDIAFVEKSNIIHTIDNPTAYRVLCKNGSLARNIGFEFDSFCPFSETIDSELVGRRDDSKINTTNTVLALLNLENWLGYRVNTEASIHMYGPFNNTYDLLFKDSTSGLVITSSTKKSVQEYKELFSHIYECSGSFAIAANSILLTLVAFYHLLPNHM